MHGSSFGRDVFYVACHGLGFYSVYRRHGTSHDEASLIHDATHGWTNGIRVITNPSGSSVGHPSGRDRLLGTMPLDFNFSRVYPRLGADSSKDRELPQ